MGTKMRKSFFAHIIVKSRSIYVKPRPKLSPAHSAHRQIHFTSGSASNLWCFSAIIRRTAYRGGHLAIYLVVFEGNWCRFLVLRDYVFMARQYP